VKRGRASEARASEQVALLPTAPRSLAVDSAPSLLPLPLLPTSPPVSTLTLASPAQADVYYCVTLLLGSIQEHYTPDQPGIQARVATLAAIVARIDAPLHKHLEELGVSYLQFTFKWFNCLLVREMRMDVVVRLWDTLLSEDDGFASFFTYVVAAVLIRFSSTIRETEEFGDVFTFLQSNFMEDFTDDDVGMICSQAFVLKSLFEGGQAHLS